MEWGAIGGQFGPRRTCIGVSKASSWALIEMMPQGTSGSSASASASESPSWAMRSSTICARL